jgi:hydroxypyruvate isomerase
VEYLFPYEYPREELKAQLDRHGLRQVLFNVPPGDWAQGDRGIAVDPGRVEEFRAGVVKAVAYAGVLGVQNLNCMAGKRVAGVELARQRQTLVENLRFAARLVGEHGLRLMVEPINHFDIPGFFLNRSGPTLEILDEVGEANVFLQYDVYHAQREEGELAATLRQQIHRIGHIQVADNPGRHQPGTGEINYPFLFAELDRLGYGGYVGLEYVPSPDSQSSFGWMQAVNGAVTPAQKV